MSEDRIAEKLQLRYGTAPANRTRRVTYWVVVILVAIAATFWLNRINTPGATGRLIAFVTHADHVSLTFETSRPAGHGSTCVLRAQDRAGFDVGYASVFIGPGPASRTLAYELRTTTEANLVDVLGCGVDVAVPQVPAPAFAPGIKPPSQPWTP